jgi:two-component system sensor histidine kinase/response regulator
MARAFDEAELVERVDNDFAFLAETVQMLTVDGRSLMDHVRRATEAGDAPTLYKSAHALKGMISNFCSATAHACALEVEGMGRGGDLTNAPAAVERLREHLEALTDELLEFVRARS